MSSAPEENAKPRTAKEYLYNLYYEILEEIKGTSISIDQDDYEDKLNTISIPSLIQYIKEAIQILLEKRIDDYRSHLDEDESKKPQEENHEHLLQKCEEAIKQKHRRLFQCGYQIENLEMQVKNFHVMEEDFEEMKAKLKYEEGKFLHNDRKENEILILRRENSNLKAVIQRFDEERKECEGNSRVDKETIVFLKAQLEEMSRKMKKLEQSQSDLTSSLNSSSLNINVHTNCVNPLKKWFLKHNEDNNITDKACMSTKTGKKYDSERNEPPLSERNQMAAKVKFISSKQKGQEKSTVIEGNGIYNIYKRILNGFDDKISPPKKSAHQKNYSDNLQAKKVNDSVKFNPNGIVNQSLKLISNNSVSKSSKGLLIEGSFTKITSLIPSTKPFPSGRTQNQFVSNPINKFYFKAGSNSSLLSLRGVKVNK